MSDIPSDWTLIALPPTLSLIIFLLEVLLISALVMAERSLTVVDQVYESEKSRRMEGRATTSLL